MTNGVFWDVTQCESCKNLCFGGTKSLLHQGENNRRRNTIPLAFLRRVRRLLVRASVVPSSASLVILMKETLSSSEMSVLTRATRRNIPEDAILQHEIGLLCVNMRCLHSKYRHCITCHWMNTTPWCGMGGSEGIAPQFLTPVDGDDWPDSRGGGF
jgi:hypothetical protein